VSAEPVISIVVAMDRNRLIGSGGSLPWHLPADLRHFKRTTMGKSVIMGRRTHQSIGKPLPGRVNIVVTSDREYPAPGCAVASSLDGAIDAAEEAQEIMIIGGAELYRQALPRTGRIYLTRIDAAFKGDTWFPEIDWKEWRVREEAEFSADDRNAFKYSFLTLERPGD